MWLISPMANITHAHYTTTYEYRGRGLEGYRERTEKMDFRDRNANRERIKGDFKISTSYSYMVD